MITWNNLDKVKAYEALKGTAKVNLAEVMAGAAGAEGRVLRRRRQ